MIAGIRHRIGRREYVQALHGAPVPESLAAVESSGETAAVLGSERGWIAAFVFSDTLRDGARELVRRLHGAGCDTSILSGDTPAAVTRVAHATGARQAWGGLSPEQKHDRIAQLQDQGAVVAMAGDGVNDAPVLARAQVSIAMGQGTELARTHGDIVLLSEDLAPLWRGLILARRTAAVIRQNLVWAIGYNTMALPLAVLGWVAPWMAGIGMSVSSLLVVLNALRLRRVPAAQPMH